MLRGGFEPDIKADGDRAGPARYNLGPKEIILDEAFLHGPSQ
jgi:hypothetical protein